MNSIFKCLPKLFIEFGMTLLICTNKAHENQSFKGFGNSWLNEEIRVDTLKHRIEASPKAYHKDFVVENIFAIGAEGINSR